MKHLALRFLVVLAVLAPGLTRAQIPNPGFETWSGGAPTGWIANNVPTFATPITQSSTAHSGSSAVAGTVVPFLTLAAYTPVLWSDFPISQRYATFTGWYTFSAVKGDSLYGWLVVSKSKTPIGYAFFNNKTTRASYTQFSVTIGYIGSGVPDSCQIWFGITGSSANNDTVHAGSTFLLDDLALSGTATGITTQPAQPAAFALSQNFPNPFNPSTVIRYQIQKSGPVQLTVYDVLGREVTTLVNGVQQEGAHEIRFDGGGLSSGVYIYRIRTNGSVQQRTMVLQK
jgi:hypothetical protein